jgi:hypothetical protein
MKRLSSASLRPTSCRTSSKVCYVCRYIVEFVRDGTLRIVAVAMAERGEASATDDHRGITGGRFRAYIEQHDRTAG